MNVSKSPLFTALLQAQNITPPIAEYRFNPERLWRIDYAWPTQLIALEVEGGAFTGGRHTRGAGFIADMEKYNALAAAGWRLFRVTPAQLLSRSTAEMIGAAIATQTGAPSPQP